MRNNCARANIGYTWGKEHWSRAEGGRKRLQNPTWGIRLMLTRCPFEVQSTADWSSWLSWFGYSYSTRSTGTDATRLTNDAAIVTQGQVEISGGSCRHCTRWLATQRQLGGIHCPSLPSAIYGTFDFLKGGGASISIIRGGRTQKHINHERRKDSEIVFVAGSLPALSFSPNIYGRCVKCVCPGRGIVQLA